MRVQRCKGTRDLLPEEMARFRLIEGVFRDCCLKWGYGEIGRQHLSISTYLPQPGRLPQAG